MEKVTRLQVPGVIGTYKNGKYRELPELIRHVRAKEIDILCDAPAAVNLDGELRRAREIHMSVAAEKLRFFYPKGLTWAAKQMANV